jgi:peptide/nickel transport system substrate-binding protein
MKTLSSFLLVLSLLFCLPDSEDKQRNTPEENFDFLRLGFPTDPTRLEPNFATDLTSEKISRLLYSPLVQKKPGGKYRFLLGESYRFQKNPPAISWKLRTDIEPEEIARSFHTLIQTSSPKLEIFSSIISVRWNPSTFTLDFSLRPGTSETEILDLLSLPAAGILGKTGPYNLESWKKGNSMVLHKNPWFRKNFPSLEGEFPERLEILVMPQSTSGLFLFSKGELDYLKLSDFLWNHPLTETHPVIQRRGRSVQYVAINSRNSCFDIHFRKALNLAIDRDKIIQKVLENQAERTLGPLPLSTWNELKKQSLTNQKEIGANLRDLERKNQTNLDYLPDLAVSELKKSKCYPEILRTPLDFRMRADDENQTKGRAVLEYIRKLGLNVRLKPMEKAPLYRENGLGQGDFTFLTWYADTPNATSFLDPVFLSSKKGNGGNRAHYENPEVDEAVKMRNNLKAIDLLLKDLPWIYLWSIQENYLISEKLNQKQVLLEYL